jgi:hypothetical protein
MQDISQFASVQVSCGCSAILALTLGERLYVASAGDSRAVLLRHPQHTLMRTGPDSDFYLMLIRIQIRLFTLIRIRIQIRLFTLMRIRIQIRLFTLMRILIQIQASK